MKISNNFFSITFDDDHPVTRTLKSIWNNIDLPSRYNRYSDEEITNILNMFNSNDKQAKDVAYNIIYSMHPEDIDRVINKQNENIVRRAATTYFSKRIENLDEDLQIGPIVQPVPEILNMTQFNCSGEYITL